MRSARGRERTPTPESRNPARGGVSVWMTPAGGSFRCAPGGLIQRLASVSAAPFEAASPSAPRQRSAPCPTSPFGSATPVASRLRSAPCSSGPFRPISHFAAARVLHLASLGPRASLRAEHAALVSFRPGERLHRGRSPDSSSRCFTTPCHVAGDCLRTLRSGLPGLPRRHLPSGRLAFADATPCTGR